MGMSSSNPPRVAIVGLTTEDAKGRLDRFGPIRSPLDDVILRQSAPVADGYTKCDEVRFDFERRRLSVVVEHQNRRTLITKGAAEGQRTPVPSGRTSCIYKGWTEISCRDPVITTFWKGAR